MKYLRLIRNVLVHKWFVFVAGRACGVSLWRCLIHDWSKFTIAEFVPYARKYCSRKPYPTRREQGRALMLCGAVLSPTQEQVDEAFDRAWLHHQHCNLHHWQSWCQVENDGSICPVQMPEKYVREMVADWWAAGRGYDGEWRLPKWYAENCENLHLHPNTRQRVEELIGETANVLLPGWENEGLLMKDGEKERVS